MAVATGRWKEKEEESRGFPKAFKSLEKYLGLETWSVNMNVCTSEVKQMVYSQEKQADNEWMCWEKPTKARHSGLLE